MIGEEDIYESPSITSYRRYLEDNLHVLHLTLTNMLEEGFNVLEQHTRNRGEGRNNGREGDGNQDDGARDDDGAMNNELSLTQFENKVTILYENLERKLFEIFQKFGFCGLKLNLLV